MPLHAWQVQEHGEAGYAFDECADRRAAETENEVALPMARNRSVADHQRISEEGFTAIASAFTRQSERTTGPQTCGELSL